MFGDDCHREKDGYPLRFLHAQNSLVMKKKLLKKIAENVCWMIHESIRSIISKDIKKKVLNSFEISAKMISMAL